MPRKLSAALVAVALFLSAFAGDLKAATIPTFSGAAGGGCSEASQIVACLNQTILAINSGVGELGSSPTQATTTGTTIQVLGTVSVPGGVLANPGQALRVKCFASDAGGAGADVLTVQVGSSTAFAVTATAATAGALDADVIVFKTGSSTQQILSKGQFNATPIAQTIVAGANSDVNGFNITCSGTTPTTGDLTLRGMYVEQIK
jgi:hypothetical protein